MSHPKRYGYASLTSHDDGTVSVLYADDVIGIARELWESVWEPGFKRPDGTIQLDTAGEYIYQQTGEDVQADVLIFERIKAG